ncbi:MAG: hypothetical protein U1F41_09795 [Burkholderiales bacterium]
MTLRRALAVVLCLLLLWLQHEALVHPISHFGVPSKEPGVAGTQAAEQCVECGLLAGGVSAAVAAFAHLEAEPPAADLVFHSYRSRDADAPAWFESRAPPVLL